MPLTTRMSIPMLQRLAGPAMVLTAFSGCVGQRGSVDLLEARIRSQQDAITQYERSLSQTQRELSRARREADLLREQMAAAGRTPLPAEYTASLFLVEQIEFNALMTGGRDRDEVPGDELLVAVFAPYDEHGDLVKLPGRIELEAFDLTQPDGEQRIAHWEFSPEQSRELWKSALFTAGYELRVEWPEPPESSELLLHARLTTTDGRQFDASQTIQIEPERPTPPAAAVAGADAEPVSARRVPETDALEASEGAAVVPVDVQALQEFLDMTDRPDDHRRPRPDQEPVLSQPQPENTDDASPSDAAEDAAANTPSSKDDEGLRTSDVWTDETIPRLR